MCNYLGCKVSRADFIRLMAIEKEVRNLRLTRPVQSGFDYRDWPILKPIAGKKDFEVKNVHWEYIPPTIYNVQQLQEARTNFTWLNARSENLYVNERGRLSMYREGAVNGRCLVLASHFYEWRHVPIIGKRGKPLKKTEAIPYYISLLNSGEYFYMAGVLREWENTERHDSADTFAIVTTEANELMAKVHNKKKRMPTILTEELAYEWLFGDLDKKRIMEIAHFQYPSDEMIAWTIDKDFKNNLDPTKEVIYEHVPAL